MTEIFIERSIKYLEDTPYSKADILHILGVVDYYRGLYVSDHTVYDNYTGTLAKKIRKLKGISFKLLAEKYLPNFFCDNISYLILDYYNNDCDYKCHWCGRQTMAACCELGYGITYNILYDTKLNKFKEELKQHFKIYGIKFAITPIDIICGLHTQDTLFAQAKTIQMYFPEERYGKEEFLAAKSTFIKKNRVSRGPHGLIVADEDTNREKSDDELYREWIDHKFNFLYYRTKIKINENRCYLMCIKKYLL